MASQPRTQALRAHLAEIVEGEPRVGAVLELLEKGESIEDIAAGLVVPYNGATWVPSRRTLNTVLLKFYAAEYQASRKAQADAYADLALATAKKTGLSREDATMAKELAATYRWLAAKRDPAAYGDTPAVAVQVNNPGNMFLQAVARPGALPPTPKQIESGDPRGVGTAPHESETEDGTEAAP